MRQLLLLHLSGYHSISFVISLSQMSLLALQVAAVKKLETRCFFGRQLLTGIALSVKNVYLHELARFSSERHYHEIKNYGGASFA